MIFFVKLIIPYFFSDFFRQINHSLLFQSDDFDDKIEDTKLNIDKDLFLLPMLGFNVIGGPGLTKLA